MNGKNFWPSLCAAVALCLSLAAPTHADKAQLATVSSSEEQTLSEIIVTARRKAENLQDVPETVNAVTPAELQKLNLQNLTDISGVVPGLQILSNSDAAHDNNTLRGVSFNPVQNTTNSTAFYLNDVFVTNTFVTTSNFDVGQIEVLRGPQGTLRGEPAPTGSITITTRRPDLGNYGGYSTGTLTQFGNANINAAVNLPLVQDKLAIRVGGLIDHNDYNQVTSVHNPADSYARTDVERISVRFEPNNNIAANVMYQHQYYHQQFYTQVEGSGAPGGVNPNAPANYTGGPITAFQRLAVDQVAGQEYIYQDIVTGQLDWRFAGQRLTYDGSWWKFAYNPHGVPTGAFQAPGITPANPIPPSPLPFSTQTNYSHELRLASDEPNRFWDYTGGLFFRHTADQVDAVQLAAFLPGSFGSPAGAANPFVFNPNYLYQLDIHAPKVEKELSVYVHVAFHLPGNNELTAGGRYVDYKAQGSVEGTSFPTKISFAIPAAFAGVCTAGGINLGALGKTGPGSYGGTYPGVCDAPIPSSVGLPYSPQNPSGHPWIYEASFSHKFNDNLLVYVSSGSSWRPPTTSIGVFNAANDPTLNSLIHLNAEKSYSFEGGFKSTFLQDRVRVNLAFYHQIYDGLIYEGLPTLYAANSGASTTVNTYPGFNSNANAVVNGIDADTGFQLTPHWNANVSASWSNGHLTGSLIPCNPPNGGTTLAAFPPGTYVFECPGHTSTSTTANFTGSAQSEYATPLTSGVDAFVRGLITFNGRNPHANINYVVPSYELTNIYLGVRSPDGAWEAMAFLKNVFNTKRLLLQNTVSQLDTAGLSTSFGPSGYYGGLLLTPPQEFGVSVTYSFGSR